MSDSTPRPWTAESYETNDDEGRYHTSRIIDAGGRTICEFSNSSVACIDRDDDYRWDSQAEVDAALIVEAVNALSAHKACVEALRKLVAAHNPYPDFSNPLTLWDRAASALAALEALQKAGE